MKQIKYGYISPINYLDLIPEHQTFHLVLTHYLKDQTYLDFYKRKQERGDTIICDNMAFELKKSLPAEELISVVESSGLNPTYVVAPDYPFEDWKVTWDSTLKFIDEVKGKNYGVMAVPQSKKGDYEGWIKCYREMLDHPDIEVIGMSILGIPNAFCSLTNTNNIAINRIFGTQYLLENVVSPGYKWHHYLGLGDGPREIFLQRHLGLMDSNDSSSPFWHGHLGIRFDETAWGLKDGKTRLEVRFEVERDLDSVKDIKFNIDYMENQILK